jgi:hypothetical protein
LATNTITEVFYSPWPKFGGLKLSQQWSEIRHDTEVLQAIVRAAGFDPDPGNNVKLNVLSATELGEQGFHNRFRSTYDCDDTSYKIQYNTGTEGIPVWVDYLIIDESGNIVGNDGNLIGGGTGFYGITVKHIDDSAAFKGIEVMAFDEDDFYLTQNDPNTDEVIIGFRGGVGPQGPQGPQGPEGPDGPQGPAGGGIGIDSEEFSTSTEWQFNHNLESSILLWNIYDAADQAIIPDKVDISNPNTAFFYFTTAVAGTAVISRGSTTLPDKFYGITVKHSDDSATFKGINTIAVEVENFYLTQNDPNTDEVQINFRGSSNGGGGNGEINTATSLGDEDVFKQKVGTNLEFRGLTAGTGISLASDATDITITATDDSAFYGVIFKESESGGAVMRDDTLVVDSASFYLSGRPDGKPLLSLKSDIDHGGLAGLGDDDHTQYARTDGTRDITGHQDFLDTVRVENKIEAEAFYMPAGGEISIFDGDNMLVSGPSGGYVQVPENLIAGDPGVEGDGISVGGASLKTAFKVSTIGSSFTANTHLHHHGDITWPALVSSRSRGESEAPHTTLLDEDNIFEILASGWGDTTYQIAGRIRFVADSDGATLTDSSYPTKIELYTRDNAESLPGIAMTLHPDKHVSMESSLFVSNKTVAEAFYSIDNGEVAYKKEIPPAFYGITVKLSDDSAAFKDINLLSFETADFYITQNASNPDEVQINFRGSVSSIDHGALQGLGDDDHTQYVLADGTRNITGDQTIEGETTSRGKVVLQGGIQGFYLPMAEDVSSAMPENNDVLTFNSGTGEWTPTESNVASWAAQTWRYRTDTADADPGSGRFRTNTSTLSTVTEIYISDLTDSGLDVSNFINLVKSGDRIYVQQSDDSTAAAVFTVDSDIVDNTSYFTIPVSFNAAASSELSQNKLCTIAFIFNLPGQVESAGPGFYGITVKQTDDLASFKGIDTIAFHADAFYITQNDPNTDEAIVNFRGDPDAELTTASSLGGDTDVFKQKAGTDLEFRGITAGNEIVLTEGANDITIESTSGPGFYGITVKQTDDAAVFSKVNVVSFNTENFYITQNDPNTDEAIVNFRGLVEEPKDFTIGLYSDIPIDEDRYVLEAYARYPFYILDAHAFTQRHSVWYNITINNIPVHGMFYLEADENSRTTTYPALGAALVNVGDVLEILMTAPLNPIANTAPRGFALTLGAERDE